MEEFAFDAALLQPEAVPDTMPSISEINPPECAAEDAWSEDGFTGITELSVWDEAGCDAADEILDDTSELLPLPLHAVSASAASNAAAVPMIQRFFMGSSPFFAAAEAPRIFLQPIDDCIV